MKSFSVIELPTFVDERGSLTVLERILPFGVVRTYWIYGADGFTRGGHRHHNTRQALIALKGAVTVYMNDGVQSDTIQLSKPNQCLIVEPKDWHTMKFGTDAILIVMSSHLYDPAEYIDEPYPPIAR